MNKRIYDKDVLYLQETETGYDLIHKHQSGKEDIKKLIIKDGVIQNELTERERCFCRSSIDFRKHK